MATAGATGMTIEASPVYKQLQIIPAGQDFWKVQTLGTAGDRAPLVQSMGDGDLTFGAITRLGSSHW